MLASRLPNILPKMTEVEAISVAAFSQLVVSQFRKTHG